MYLKWWREDTFICTSSYKAEADTHEVWWIFRSCCPATVVHNSFKHFCWLSKAFYELLVCILNLSLLCPFVFHKLPQRLKAWVALKYFDLCYLFFFSLHNLAGYYWYELTTVHIKNRDPFIFQHQKHAKYEDLFRYELYKVLLSHAHNGSK